MEFYLPVAGPLKADALDALIRQYDPLSARLPACQLPSGAGMLKGVYRPGLPSRRTVLPVGLQIELAGREQRSLYPAGDGGSHANASLRSAHQLYTLALHRYLRHRYCDYRYDDHFGGVIYLFLRGVDAVLPIRAPGSSALVRMRN